MGVGEREILAANPWTSVLLIFQHCDFYSMLPYFLLTIFGASITISVVVDVFKLKSNWVILNLLFAKNRLWSSPCEHDMTVRISVEIFRCCIYLWFYYRLHIEFERSSIEISTHTNQKKILIKAIDIPFQLDNWVLNFF